MIVLGLDTATPATAVALRLDDGSITEARDDPAPGEHPGHATRLLAMAHELLRASGVRWSELERIAAGVGPGTFTGLRVGLATARGLAQSLSIELAGVSSLQALALPALAEGIESADRPAAGGKQAVLAVIDARRGEAFAAAYEAQQHDQGPAGLAEAPVQLLDAPVELLEARALSPEDLAGLADAAAGRAAEGEPRWLAVGDGAVRYRGRLERLGVTVPADSSPLHRVSAAAICQLGAAADPAGSLEQLLPDYRRRPDAELALEAAAAGGSSG